MNDKYKKASEKYRTVEEIMEEFGAKGKHSEREYLQDVLVRIDCLWRREKAKAVPADSSKEAR